MPKATSSVVDLVMANVKLDKVNLQAKYLQSGSSMRETGLHPKLFKCMGIPL